MLAGTDDETTTLLVYGVDPTEPELATIIADLDERLAEVPGASLLDPLVVPPLPDGSPNPQVASLFADDGNGVLFVASISTTEYVGGFGETVDRVDDELGADGG